MNTPKLYWEQIDNYHQRCKVPGGWLVKAYEDVYADLSNYNGGIQSPYSLQVSMCFLPDPNYKWKESEIV